MTGPLFEARPPAKVNLTLEILGRRPDGFHDLRSVFVRVGLCDRLTMQPAAPDVRDDRLTVTGMPGIPVAGNLVLRALAALRARAGIALPPLDVTLEKRIPAAAGLGGGSSDAASAVKLALAAWGIGLSSAHEAALAASLGSDVPFFSSGVAAAIVEGRGERVMPLDPAIAALLLVTPPLALPAAAVYDRYDEIPAGSGSMRGENHLWAAAASLAPQLPVLRDHLEHATGLTWQMTGSGSTLFALYPSVEAAAEAGRSLAAARSAHLENAKMHAVDLVGPDPAWRYP